MLNPVVKRLELLRSVMKDNNCDWYFFTSDDYHASEYVADFFKIREYFTGFTGENAFLLLNDSDAYMWTDARFFLQADIELKDSTVKLMKMGEPGVPTISEFVKANLKTGESLFFDGRMVSTQLGLKLESLAQENGASVVYDCDLAGSLWEKRPALPVSNITIYDESLVGESVSSKIARIRAKMDEYGAKTFFLGSIDDIAWITNMRGRDVDCNPVYLSYMLITSGEAVLFMEKEEVTETVWKYLDGLNIKIDDYNNILEYLKNYSFEGPVLLDTSAVNFSCYKIISDKVKVINRMNPSKPMKAVKNDTEIKRLKECYINDSVCVTKFIYWLKNNASKGNLTEIKASDYLDNLRGNVPGFLDLSFPTISGYGQNGAIVHYSATPESDAVIKPEGMLLVDSGGQYQDGTTDITRTISVGPVTEEMRLHYTKVAVGMLSLAAARFLHGCTGRNLDILARKPLWDIGLDFKHGTGHGIGYILNVHEGPQNIRWKFAEGSTEYPLEAGMVTSDEPGVYIEGKYGIRIENAILCVRDKANEYGDFLKFEHLTYTPLDRELLDKSVLSDSELELVNSYNEMVYKTTADLLTGEEAKWLFDVTRPL